MRKNLVNLIKKLLNLLKYIIFIGILIHLIKNGLNIRLLTKLIIVKNEFNSDKSIEFQIKINLESSYFDTNYFKALNQTPKLYDLTHLIDNSNSTLNLCKYIPDNLNGRVRIDKSEIDEKSLELKYAKQFPNFNGGHWKPLSCQSRYKVAIVVPYRDRYPHLKSFLNHMHSFLQKQQLDYAIYIIEEVNYNLKIYKFLN